MLKRIVVGATVETDNIILDLADGNTVVLRSDDETTHRIMDKITPALALGQTVELDEDEKKINVYKKFEEKSNGFVRFFRAAKAAILGRENVTPQYVESIALPDDHPVGEDEMMVAVIRGETLEPAPSNEVGDATPQTTSPSSAVVEAANESSRETVEEETTSTVIPNADALEGHIRHNIQNKSTPEGINKFLARVATVIEKRRHSVEDLLEFMRKNDMPIANDGCIIAYKRLNNHGNYFTDTHTGKVKQKVGSKVLVAEELVDPDRHHECSNGLHVGRRDYMGSFSGNGIVIVKIAPEDVIAVPQDYGRSKMRCCGYHIICQLNEEGFKLLCEDKPMTNNEKMALMLTNIIEGNHPPAHEIVRINGHLGNNVTITPINHEAATVVAESLEDMTQANAEQIVTQEAPVLPVNGDMVEPEGDAPKEQETPVSEPEKKPDARKEKKAQRKAAKASVSKPVPDSVMNQTKKRAKAADEVKPAPKKTVKPTKAIERPGKDGKVKADKNLVSPQVIKEKAKAAKATAPEIGMEPTMTEDQKRAKARWHEVQAGTLSKAKLAQECNTSSRSLDRWAIKFNF